jgi:hypothetical protein
MLYILRGAQSTIFLGMVGFTSAHSLSYCACCQKFG